MQTFINILAVTSFLVSASVVGTCTYVYVNKDLIRERVKEAVIQEVQGLLPEVTEIVPDTTMFVEDIKPSLPF